MTAAAGSPCCRQRCLHSSATCVALACRGPSQRIMSALPQLAAVKGRWIWTVRRVIRAGCSGDGLQRRPVMPGLLSSFVVLLRS